jgi:hypothetical protein
MVGLQGGGQRRVGREGDVRCRHRQRLGLVHEAVQPY